jgi:hypothetical protein
VIFKWELGTLFKEQFSFYPKDQQDAVIKFITTYQNFGLNDFSSYEGKLSPSYKGIDKTDPVYEFTYTNNLWHYHIGLPSYAKSKSAKYLTSDMILHFQCKDTNYIRLLDITWHYKADGTFWLPSKDYLTE